MILDGVGWVFVGVLRFFAGVSVVGSGVSGMAQQFEHDGSPRVQPLPGQAVECRAAVPVLNPCPPAGDPVVVIDLAALAHTAGERVLAELISTSHAAPVGTQLASASVDPQLYTLLT